MRHMKGIIIGALLVSVPAHAVELDDLKALRRGQIAGVDYLVGSKSLKLKGSFEGLEAAAKLGYRGNHHLSVQKQTRDGRWVMDVSERDSTTTVFIRLEKRF